MLSLTFTHARTRVRLIHERSKHSLLHQSTLVVFAARRPLQLAIPPAPATPPPKAGHDPTNAPAAPPAPSAHCAWNSVAGVRQRW